MLRCNISTRAWASSCAYFCACDVCTCCLVCGCCVCAYGTYVTCCCTWVLMHMYTKIWCLWYTYWCYHLQKMIGKNNWHPCVTCELGLNYVYICIIMFYFFTIFWVGQKVVNIGFGIANSEVYMNYELIPKTIKNDMWCDGFTSIVTLMSWEHIGLSNQQ